MTIKNNLPSGSTPTDSSTKMRTFFDSYYQKGISLTAGELDTTIGFFTAKGFEKSAADTIGSTLLSHAKSEGVNVTNLLDTLNGLNKLQMSRVITEILNYNRLRISTLGYRVDNSKLNEYELRNIKA
jgi:hypothetical protein